MSPKQKKIAAKAPPPNKIDEKDFAVLRKEKAKGRGMGLQDENVQPGKVQKAALGLMFMKKAKDKGAKGAEFLSPLAMLKRISGKKAGGVMKANKGKMASDRDRRQKELIKKQNPISEYDRKGKLKYTAAKMGKSIKADTTKTITDKGQFVKRRKQLGGGRSKLPGRIGTALGAVSMLVPAAYAAAKQYKDYKSAKNRDEAKVKKMGGGMMKKYSKGGGHYDDKNKNVVKHIRVKKKMGGGMIAQSQRPGYSKGTMVKARGCKLGRTRPTKIT